MEVDFGSNESLAEPFFWCRVGFLYPGEIYFFKVRRCQVSGGCNMYIFYFFLSGIILYVKIEQILGCTLQNHK